MPSSGLHSIWIGSPSTDVLGFTHIVPQVGTSGFHDTLWNPGPPYQNEDGDWAEDKLPPPLYELRRTGPACRSEVCSAGISAGKDASATCRLEASASVPDMGCIYLIERYQREVMEPTLAEPQGVAVR